MDILKNHLEKWTEPAIKSHNQMGIEREGKHEFREREDGDEQWRGVS